LREAAKDVAARRVEPGFSLPGRSLSALREVAYELMGLVAPPDAVTEPPPLRTLTLEARHPSAFRVVVRPVKESTDSVGDVSAVSVERFSALLPVDLRDADAHHIAADLEHPHLRHLRQAAVLYTRSPADAAQADAVFRDYPGARVFARIEGEVCVLHLAEGAGASARVSGADPALAASLVYARLSGVLLGGAFDPARVDLGGRVVGIEFTDRREAR
jgi:hypothetical protein